MDLTTKRLIIFTVFFTNIFLPLYFILKFSVWELLFIYPFSMAFWATAFLGRSAPESSE